MEHRFDEKTADFGEGIFSSKASQKRTSSSSEAITLERLNSLLDDGHITSWEYSSLLSKLYPFDKQTSCFAWATLICSILNWVLMLNFKIGDENYQLLTGEGRLISGTILAPLALVLFFTAAKEIRLDDDIKGFEIAVAGLALAVAILTIVVPVHLIRIFQ